VVRTTQFHSWKPNYRHLFKRTQFQRFRRSGNWRRWHNFTALNCQNTIRRETCRILFYQTNPDILLRTAHQFKCVIWKTTNHQSVRFLQDGFFKMKRFHRVRMYFHQVGRFVYWQRRFVCRFKTNACIFHQRNVWKIKKFVCVRLIFLLQNQVRLIFIGFKTRNRLQNYQRNRLVRIMGCGMVDQMY
jgi:hypothetical protein